MQKGVLWKTMVTLSHDAYIKTCRIGSIHTVYMGHLGIQSFMFSLTVSVMFLVQIRKKLMHIKCCYNLGVTRGSVLCELIQVLQKFYDVSSNLISVMQNLSSKNV